MTKINYSKRMRVKFYGKRLGAMALFVLTSLFGNAQVSAYGFNATSGAFTAITGGTVLGSTASDDQVFNNNTAGQTAPITNTGFAIGFNFTYNGTVYDKFAVNNNGWIKLGTGSFQISGSAGAPLSAAGPVGFENVISALGFDLQGQAGGTLRYELTGTSPNQVLVVQWAGYREFGSTGQNYNFQIRLYETSNNIEFVYGTMTNTATYTCQVGLRGATNADFNNRTTTTSWASTTAGGTNTANCSFTAAIFPASGQTFTFTPPPPCTGTPTAGTPTTAVYNICSGTAPGVLSYTGGTSGVTGLTYNWESSPDGSVWTPTGVTTATYTAPNYVGVDQYYHLLVTCTTGPSTSAFPTPIYVTAPIAPTTQTSNIAITTANATSLAVNWTNGNGLNGRVVYVNTVNSFVDPANGSSPTANTVYAGGQQCVFNGTGGAVTVTNLLPGTTYYFRSYEVTCTGASTQYNTSTAANNPIGLNTADVLRYAITRTTGVGYSPVSGAAIQLHGGVTAVDDAMSVATSIGFNFTYGGVTRTQFRASTNGFISLNPAVGTSTFSNAFANSTAHNTIVAPFWEDLLLPANLGTVKYELTGVSPNQVLTIQWADAEVFNYPGPSINFQIKLYETTNVIEFVYGTMQGFDGTNPNSGTVTNGYAFSYSVGLSNGSWTALPTGAQAGEIIAQQRANAVNFGSLGTFSTNEGLNKLSVMPECSSMLTFTPQAGIRANDPAPGLPAAPSNDEWTSPVVLTPLLTTPANFCGSYYTSAFATPTAGVPAPIASTLADDDVWFQFTANATNTTITVRGAGGYNVAMQVMDEFATTVLASKNANGLTGTSLTETINSVDLTTAIGTIYLVRVYHANATGTVATATATVTSGAITGFTIGAGGAGYITCYGGAGVTATPFVYITDPTGSGAVGKVTVTAGAISAIAIQGGQNGTGYSATPTVTIANPSYGVTGDFSIIVNATPVPPANDNICTATVLTPGATCVNTSGNTYNASASPEAACAGNPDDDVWYSWVCQGTETVSVTSAPSFNAHLQVFSSSDNTCTGTLTSMGCVNANGNGGSETFSGAFVVGNTYFARVYHSGILAGSSGNFSICVTGIAPSCPSLTTPANASTVGSSPVTLTWAAAAGASGYDVYLDQVDGLTTLVSANQVGTTYSGAITAGSWFWRVVAKNATYGDATGCTVRTFSTAAALCPVYTAPANAAVVYGPAGVVLQWNASVGGASGYNVYFDTNPTPTTLVSSNQPGLTYNTGVLPNTGLTYYWRVDALGTFGASTGCAVGNFLTGAPAPPANDEPCAAIALTVNAICGYTTYTNAAATASAGIPAPGCAGYSGGDVWFTITVPAGGEVDIDMNTGVITDSGLAAYTATGSCPSTLSLSLLDCDDDGSNNGFMSKLSLTGLTPASTLYLRVWELGNNNNGTFQICAAIPPVPATNDEVCTAIPVTVNPGCTPITTHNFGSTETLGQPATLCGTPETDVWYSFVAPASGHVIITASQIPGGLTDGVMNLYSSTGSCPTPTLTAVECDDDDGPGLLPLINRTGLTPGATYYLRFWGFLASEGYFGLCIANGATPPPTNDEPATATNVPIAGNAYPSCGALLGDITTATNSAQSTTFTGADVWYKFTAQSTGVRIVLSSGSMNGSITLLDNTFTQIQTENANAATGGTEILNFGGLTVGQVYYVGVGQDTGAGGGPFSLCVQSLRASTCADGPGAYDLCTNFKPTYTGANSYAMSFTQTSPIAGPTTVASTPNQLALSSPTLDLQHTYGYNVTINAVYNLVNGVGTPETITVNGTATCAITIAAHPDLRTKFAQRCPATVFKGTTLQAKPFICAAVDHTITFTEVGDCSGTNVGGIAFNTTTAGSSPTKKLSQVAGVQAGKWYEVTWTPNFSYGAGTPGSTDIIYVAASSGAEDVVSEFENTMDSEEVAVSANIYPNPNNGDMVNINITDITSDNVFVRIFDNMGRVVYVNRFTVDGSLNTNVTFTKPLANGLYMVEFTVDGETFTERMIVEK